MTAVIGALEALLNTCIASIHHGSGREMELTVRSSLEKLTEMSLTQPMSCFMQRYCLDIYIRIDLPGKSIVVKNLAESHVRFAVVVNVRWDKRRPRDKNKSKGSGDDIVRKNSGGKPTGVGYIGLYERTP
ncbi:MAG TPA: hypothetical protein VFZ34_12795 [Blastocatellia bacterium]|nr:hypothetical protein [Blastocatellia bacterium]